MFVRKKKNRSGTTSVVIVDKHGGKFKELCTIGIGHSDEEIASLYANGTAWIKNRMDYSIVRSLFLTKYE